MTYNCPLCKQPLPEEAEEAADSAEAQAASFFGQLLNDPGAKAQSSLEDLIRADINQRATRLAK